MRAMTVAARLLPPRASLKVAVAVKYEEAIKALKKMIGG